VDYKGLSGFTLCLFTGDMSDELLFGIRKLLNEPADQDFLSQVFS